MTLFALLLWGLILLSQRTAFFDLLLSAEAHMLIERFHEPSWLSLFFGFVDGRLPRLLINMF